LYLKKILVKDSDINIIGAAEEYLVSLIDLISFPDKPVEYVRHISRENFSKYLIVLYAFQQNRLREELNAVGADFCFSLDSEPEELVQTILQLDHK